MIQSGAIVAGRYRAGRRIGAGGMGAIFEATHIELGSAFAIKVLHEQAVQDGDGVERFLREARSAAKLRGEHVCRVFDCGTLESGQPFMVMEQLAGCDLGALLAQLGPLPPLEVADYARQACAGIAEAHGLGIVHRDIKPTNIFRTSRPDGTVLIKLLDFGLAKPMNGQELSLTQTADVIGSPRYMSPEQLRSTRLADPRSDLWALGVVMYELVCGKPPFTAGSLTELALKIDGDPVPKLPPTVPPWLDTAIMRCLAKSPTDRYQSAVELAAALVPTAVEPPASSVEPPDEEVTVPAAMEPSDRATTMPVLTDSRDRAITSPVHSETREGVAVAPSVLALKPVARTIIGPRGHAAPAPTTPVLAAAPADRAPARLGLAVAASVVLGGAVMLMFVLDRGSAAPAAAPPPSTPAGIAAPPVPAPLPPHTSDATLPAVVVVPHDAGVVLLREDAAVPDANIEKPPPRRKRPRRGTLSKGRH